MLNDEKLFKFILKCKKAQQPDLHSFMIMLNNGKAFVECRDYGEVYIEHFDFSVNPEKRYQFCGTPIAATNYLTQKGAKFETIEQ